MDLRTLVGLAQPGKLAPSRRREQKKKQRQEMLERFLRLWAVLACWAVLLLNLADC